MRATRRNQGSQPWVTLKEPNVQRGKPRLREVGPKEQRQGLAPGHGPLSQGC